MLWASWKGHPNGSSKWKEGEDKESSKNDGKTELRAKGSTITRGVKGDSYREKSQKREQELEIGINPTYMKRWSYL